MKNTVAELGDAVNIKKWDASQPFRCMIPVLKRVSLASLALLYFANVLQTIKYHPDVMKYQKATGDIEYTHYTGRYKPGCLQDLVVLWLLWESCHEEAFKKPAPVEPRW